MVVGSHQLRHLFKNSKQGQLLPKGTFPPPNCVIYFEYKTQGGDFSSWNRSVLINGARGPRLDEVPMGTVTSTLHACLEDARPSYDDDDNNVKLQRGPRRSGAAGTVESSGRCLPLAEAPWRT